MLDANHDEPTPGGTWIRECEQAFRAFLQNDPHFAVFVIDAPGAPGRLASCAGAGLSLRLPGHSSTALWHGEIHQVAAEPAYRRRGYARRVTRAARDWLAAQGCSSAALTATESGIGLCEELGFRPIPYQRMVWRPERRRLCLNSRTSDHRSAHPSPDRVIAGGSYAEHTQMSPTLVGVARELYAIEVDRLLAFADAVTAIAITLLALELHVPDGLPAAELGHALYELLLKIYAYLLTFAVIGLLWLGHHRLFRMVATLDRTMVRLELGLLAVVAALPFPTRLLSEYGQTFAATAVYAGALATVTAVMTVMCLRLRHPGPLRAPGVTQQQVQQAVYGNATLAAAFATSIPVALLSPTLAKCLWWLTFLARLAPRFR
ncbi:TMEM175 family protein [Streptomyces gamaensis]|uniref:TMEM175 family protein n=1 Tax=Streptomyces gamaensis TaxID=1763542 RepID=A0ABW0Z039_9ACTN